MILRSLFTGRALQTALDTTPFLPPKAPKNTEDWFPYLGELSPDSYRDYVV